LELGSCGRGFDDKAAALVASAGPLSGLRVCRLTGAYRLGDSGLLQLLGAAPGVLELAVPSAPRLTGMCDVLCCVQSYRVLLEDKTRCCCSCFRCPQFKAPLNTT
jgi:hypothetical protein